MNKLGSMIKREVADYLSTYSTSRLALSWINDEFIKESYR